MELALPLLSTKALRPSSGLAFLLTASLRHGLPLSCPPRSTQTQQWALPSSPHGLLCGLPPLMSNGHSVTQQWVSLPPFTASPQDWPALSCLEWASDSQWLALPPLICCFCAPPGCQRTQCACQSEVDRCRLTSSSRTDPQQPVPLPHAAPRAGWPFEGRHAGWDSAPPRLSPTCTANAATTSNSTSNLSTHHQQQLASLNTGPSTSTASASTGTISTCTTSNTHQHWTPAPAPLAPALAPQALPAAMPPTQDPPL
jgi:hypothetical protein